VRYFIEIHTKDFKDYLSFKTNKYYFENNCICYEVDNRVAMYPLFNIQVIEIVDELEKTT